MSPKGTQAPEQVGAKRPASVAPASQTPDPDAALNLALMRLGVDVPSTATSTEKSILLHREMCRAAGVKSHAFANHLVHQITRMLVTKSHTDDAVNFADALAVLAEMKPRGPLEAMLAVQAVGIHHAVCSSLARVAAPNQPMDVAEFQVRQASRLSRVFTEQLDAMAQLRGKRGRQKVTVRHVHVHPGGQAIVGAVSMPKRLKAGQPELSGEIVAEPDTAERSRPRARRGRGTE